MNGYSARGSEMEETMSSLTALQLIADSGLLVLIWLVQFIIYPSFRYTREKEFIAWHGRYTALIGLIVTPLMILQAGVEVACLLEQEPRWQRILLIVIVWSATFSLSVPCHSRLHRAGKNLIIIKRLVTSNWIRTLCWSLLFLETIFISNSKLF